VGAPRRGSRRRLISLAIVFGSIGNLIHAAFAYCSVWGHRDLGDRAPPTYSLRVSPGRNCSHFDSRNCQTLEASPAAPGVLPRQQKALVAKIAGLKPPACHSEVRVTRDVETRLVATTRQRVCVGHARALLRTSRQQGSRQHYIARALRSAPACAREPVRQTTGCRWP
jgi:hypothetical protein